jgi:hypothetical protein
MNQKPDLKKTSDAFNKIWNRALLYLRIFLPGKDGNITDDKLVKNELTNGVKKMIGERKNIDEIVLWLKEFLHQNGRELSTTKDTLILDRNPVVIECVTCVIGNTSFIFSADPEIRHISMNNPNNIEHPTLTITPGELNNVQLVISYIEFDKFVENV